MLDRAHSSCRMAFLPPPEDVIHHSAGEDPWDSLDVSDQKVDPDTRFTLESFASIEPVLSGSWIIKGLLPSSGLAVLYGEPGCGKSFLALDAALHVAAGRPWAGKRVKQAGVVYIAAEGAGGFRKRVVAARQHYDLPADTPFALIVTPPDLGSEAGDATALIDAIRRQSAAIGFRPGLIIIDTLARSMEGADESSSRDMGLFVGNAGRIERELGVLVLAVHHSGKDIERGMRGSSALHGATSAEWEVSGEEGDRTFRVAKMKDAEGGETFVFRMFQVEVGRDEDGDPVTTLVAEVSGALKHDETSKRNGRKPLTGQRAEFVKALRMALDDMGSIPAPNDHVPAGQKVVTRKQLALYADKLGFLSEVKESARRPTLDRHVRTLAGDGHIGQWGETLWLP